MMTVAKVGAIGAVVLYFLGKRKKESTSGIGDLTAWNKRHLYNYFESSMWGGRVEVNTGSVDDRGYYPVDFYTDKNGRFANFTYLISPNNIEYLKELCRIYHCDFEIVNEDVSWWWPNTHKVGKVNHCKGK